MQEKEDVLQVLDDQSLDSAIWHTEPYNVATFDESDVSSDLKTSTWSSTPFDPEERHASDRRFFLTVIGVCLISYVLLAAYVVVTSPADAKEQMSQLHSVTNAALMASLAYFFSTKK